MEKHPSEDQKQLLVGLTYLSDQPQQQPKKKKINEGKGEYTKVLCEPLQSHKTIFF